MGPGNFEIPVHFDQLVTWYNKKMGPKVAGPKSPQYQKSLVPKDCPFSVICHIGSINPAETLQNSMNVIIPKVETVDNLNFSSSIQTVLSFHTFNV